MDLPSNPTRHALSPMTPSALIETIYAHFESASSWPTLRFLQARFGTKVNVRALAAEIGPDLVVCQEGDDPQCFLTLSALAAIPAAAEDLALLASAIRFIASKYASSGPGPVTHDQIQAALGVSSTALRRLGLLLRILHGPWGASSWSNDGAAFAFHLCEDAFFYQDVRTYEDIREIQLRLAVDRQRIAERLNYGWKRANRRLARPAQATEWPKVERQVEEMRARFATAKTEEQFQAIGLLCREILISLAEATHDPARHPPLDGVSPSDTDAKRRLEAFFEVELEDRANEAARRHAKAAVSLANDLQHKRTADYRTAALCAEATVSVINLVAILQDRED